MGCNFEHLKTLRKVRRPMIFTRLKHAQIDDLVEVMNKYKKEIGEETLHDAEVTNLKKAIIEGQITYYIGMEGSKILATCSLSRCFSSYKCRPMAIFEDFYVEKSHRACGIAQGLVTYVREISSQEGLDSIWVGASGPLKDMYIKLGFEMTLGTLLSFNT